MRSTFFVFLSMAFHGLCVAAVALAPAKLAQPGNEVEMVVEDPILKPGVEAAQTEVVQVEETKPSKVEEPAVVKVEKKLPPKKQAVAKAEPKKVIETKFTELPAKEVKSEELSPEIEDEQAVAVVPAKTAEVKETVADEGEKLIPVKEHVAGVEAMASDEEVEATGKEVEEIEDTPAGNDGASSGTPQKGPVSYLDLKQQGGNKGPSYPLQARKEGRQGQVELLYRVTKEGNVADLTIAKSSGHKDLDQEAVRAISAFHFVPGQEGWARHPVNFALKGSADTMPSRLRSSSAQTE